jgi:signal transduction histidine kinase
MRIRPKLFVIILTLVLLSLLITSAVSIDAFSHAMTTEIKKRLETTTVLMMKQISFITSQKVSDAQMLSSFIGKLLRSNQSGVVNGSTIEEMLRSVVSRETNNTAPSFNSISVYNKTGTRTAQVITKWNDDDNNNNNNDKNNNNNNFRFSHDDNPVNEEFFKTAINGKSYHDNIPWYSSFLNESIVRVSTPIYNRDNNNTIAGVLVLGYRLNELVEYVANISPNANGRSKTNDDDRKINMTIHLLSQKGTQIYYSNFSNTPEFNRGNNSKIFPIFQQIKESQNRVVSGIYPANTVDNTYGETKDAVFVATKGNIGKNNDIDNTITNNSSSTASTKYNIEYDGNKENNWFLITSLGNESAFEEMTSLKNTFILVTLLVLAGAAVVVFYISRIISKPIMKLKDAAISIARGNLNIPFIFSSSKDEIGELAVQFETMRDSIKNYTDDLTKKEKELQQYNDELIANDRAKEEFISMVSHELRTPLVPIKLYSQMLLRPKIMGELSEKQKKAVETINRSMMKQEQLVEDILDVFKLDMGKLHLSKLEIDISYLVSEIVNDLKSFTIEKKIQITYHINIHSIKTVFCDRRRIEQVFANLIKNAIDFVPERTGKIRVQAQEIQNPSNITSKGDNTDYETIQDSKSMAVLFSVEDNGRGIPIEKADNLFKKFYQIDTSATRKHGGTGLGLAICKGIVEAHGGKIWIDKNYIGGTAIRFTIPSNCKV